jgi:hypothetical protein
VDPDYPEAHASPAPEDVLMASRSDTRPPWKRPKPDKDSSPLSPKEKDEARARARAAGRRYPNLVDNMAVARQRARKKSVAATAKKNKR